MEYKITVATTGADGAATGTGDSERPIEGLIHAIKVDWAGTAPATSTLTLIEQGGAGQTILNMAAGNTDLMIYPRVKAQDNTGIVDTGGYDSFYVPGRKLRATVALSNALSPAVTLYIYTIPLQ